MNLTRIIILFCIFSFVVFPHKVFALMEISGSFSYDRTVYGSSRQNKQIDRTWGAALAFFLSNFTAIELNYSLNDEITKERETIPVSGYNLNLIGTNSTVENQVYGVGLRQVFAGRKARFKPSLSLGYAKQFIVSSSNATYQDTSNGNTFLFTGTPSKERLDSVFATFAIQLSLTARLSLRGSVNTLFKANDLNGAKDNLKYMVGFSWIL